MNREEMLEIISNTENSMTADGYDDCIVGIAERCNQEPLVVYDRDKIIEKLAKDMSYEEAEEFFNFNIIGAWVGEGTPLFLTKLEEE